MSDWGDSDDSPVVKRAGFAKAESDDGWGSGSDAPAPKVAGFAAAAADASDADEDDWEKEAELADARARAEAAKAELTQKAAAEQARMDALVADMAADFGDSPVFENPLKKTTKVVKQAAAVDVADFWETLKFTRLVDLENFGAKMVPKIKESAVNSAGFYKLALMLLPEMCAKMDQKDIGNLQKKLDEEFKKKNVQKGATRDMKKKPNDKVNADEELDIRYGAIAAEEDYDEDDYYDEDY